MYMYIPCHKISFGPIHFPVCEASGIPPPHAPGLDLQSPGSVRSTRLTPPAPVV